MVQGLLCCIFSLKYCQMFLMCGRFGLQVWQFSTLIFFLLWCRSAAICAECRLTPHWWEKPGLKKDIVRRAEDDMWLPDLHRSFITDGPPQGCGSTSCYVHWCTLTPSGMVLFDCAKGKNETVYFNLPASLGSKIPPRLKSDDSGVNKLREINLSLKLYISVIFVSVVFHLVFMNI